MGPVSKDCITIAPAFYISQVDLAGPFDSYSYHNKRKTTVKIWLAVFCCCTTSATNIKTMQDYSASAFISSFTRFACQVGFPKRLLADEGGQLIRGCNNVVLNFQNIKFQLHRDHKVEFEVCPVGGHNMHGKVERRIRHIKESLNKTMFHERLGPLEWETIAAITANCINNLPLALGSVTGDLDNLDLITPNRLLLGRNNERSPVGNMCVTDAYDKMIETNGQIFDAWFENWLVSHVPKLMDQPKWFKGEYDLQVGDIVLFPKQESAISGVYQYGMVSAVYRGEDNRVRKVDVTYRNSTEKVDRVTFRSARSLVVIHPVDEVDILQELGEISLAVDQERAASIPQSQ